MAGGEKQKKELERYPRMRKAYLRAFENMIKKRKEDHMEDVHGQVWQTGEDVMRWWLGEEE